VGLSAPRVAVDPFDPVASLLLRAHIERSAPDELCDQRPRLTGGSDRFVKRQFVEGGSVGQVGKRKQLLHRQHAFEDNTMELADESAPRVEPVVAHGVREELYEQLSETVAVGGVQGLGAAAREDGHRVGADAIHVLEQGLEIRCRRSSCMPRTLPRRFRVPSRSSLNPCMLTETAPLTQAKVTDPHGHTRRHRSFANRVPHHHDRRDVKRRDSWDACALVRRRAARRG
jgi:hypothetical protein